MLDLNDTKSGSRNQPKETFSLYDCRFMSKLRRAAFLLYQSEPFSMAIQKLEVRTCTVGTKEFNILNDKQVTFSSIPKR